MSFYTDASLIMFPSGYKEDKIYSLKPTDGSGDLTFTRASTATRVNADGLIETSPVNLVENSENFSAVWTAQNVTITTNSIVAPNGTTTADSLIANNGVNSASGVYVAENTSVVKTMSCYVKKGSKRWAAFIGYSGYSNCWYDLDNGVVGTRGANYSTSSITSVGNGWYRIDAVMTVAIGADVNIGIYAADNDNDLTCTGDGTTVSSYIWGAQLNIGATAKPYFPTTDRLNVPRIDYTGGGCGKLLLEPQRTNLITYSEQFDNAAWTPQSGASVSANTTISPDGTQNADTLSMPSSSYLYYLDGTNLTSQKVTLSFYAKGTNGQTIVTRANTSTNDSQYQAHTLTGEWQRIEQTFDGGSYNYIYPFDARQSMTATSMQIWGAQLEAGSYATSYIPTLASSVTRLADACFKTGISSLIGQTEGTLFAEFNVLANQESQAIWIRQASGGLYGDFLFILTNNAQQPRVQVVTGGVAQFDYTASSISVGYHKFALAYKENDFAFYIDGVQITTSLTGSVPTCDEMYLGYYPDGGVRQTSQKQSILFPTRLTNTQLATLTTL